MKTWQLMLRTREAAARAPYSAPYVELPMFQAEELEARKYQADLQAASPSLEWALIECRNACPRCGYVYGLYGLSTPKLAARL